MAKKKKPRGSACDVKRGPAWVPVQTATVLHAKKTGRKGRPSSFRKVERKVAQKKKHDCRKIGRSAGGGDEKEPSPSLKTGGAL